MSAMNTVSATSEESPVTSTATRFEWSKAYFSAHFFTGSLIVLFLLLRTAYALFFFYGFWHKFRAGWLTSGILEQHFLKRLSELDPSSFSALYLSSFAIPLYVPIAWIVTIGEVTASVCLLIGLATRFNGGLALFLLTNFSLGAFFNLTMPPLMFIAVLLIALPSGHWLGLDRKLHAAYPNSIWFK